MYVTSYLRRLILTSFRADVPATHTRTHKTLGLFIDSTITQNTMRTQHIKTSYITQTRTLTHTHTISRTHGRTYTNARAQTRNIVDTLLTMCRAILICWMATKAILAKSVLLILLRSLPLFANALMIKMRRHNSTVCRCSIPFL